MKVEPGQVWQDNNRHRTIKIKEVDSRYVYGIASGKSTRILLNRFSPNRYTLIKEFEE